jgi:uncharacterized protein YdeI (BOF family)
MKLIKRDLILCIAFTAFVFVCALAWGSPFIRNNAGSGATVTQAQPVSAQSSVFRGTVVRNGEQFMLRDGSGQVFRLDNPEQAQSFEDKAVTITGMLDSGSRIIHVERIESAMA